MSSTTKKPYQTLRAELDEVLAKLQQPDCDVDEAVKLYEKGLDLANQLKASLETTENKITKLQQP